MQQKVSVAANIAYNVCGLLDITASAFSTSSDEAGIRFGWIMLSVPVVKEALRSANIMNGDHTIAATTTMSQ